MTQHHVQVLVSRENFFNNIQYLRRLVAPSKLCVVMKANAYGHGLEALAPVAVEAGADMLGICTNPEAETIRRLGLKFPCSGSAWRSKRRWRSRFASSTSRNRLAALEAAAYLSAAGCAARPARRRPSRYRHRDGPKRILPEQIETIRQVMSLPGLRIAGVMSHFPTADASDLAQTNAQIERMERFCAELGLPETCSFTRTTARRPCGSPGTAAPWCASGRPATACARRAISRIRPSSNR
jgi:alanine racemase